jgi:hypothetical protein
MKRQQDQDQDQVTAAVAVAVAKLSTAVRAGVFGDGPSVVQFKKAVMHEALGRRFKKQDEDVLVYQYDDDLAIAMIEKAIAGDTVADTLLREAAIEKLQAELPLPPNLARYIADNVLAGHVRTKHPGGRPDYFDRDAWIYLAVDYTLKRGFKLTRNEVSKSETASSIVAEALLELGVTLSDKRVAGIWRDMHLHLSRYGSEQWWLF